ncbi:MAG: YHYH protein, partial [Gammaproteobacteria bacterium]
ATGADVPIGCNVNDPWLLDPLGTLGGFGVDANNAHTQPDGTYHYHGDPEAMFDDNPGPNGSPVIGFAADGYPIFGSYFLDMNTGFVRKAVSGYALKAGNRPNTANDPGGTYDGRYVDDYEFANAGDLDECNGMTVNGQYGYYVTDGYPWVMKCHTGTVDPSFSKN